jgi:serine protease SohB
MFPLPWLKRGPVAPVLRLHGPIGLSTPLRPGLSLASLSNGIERAFNMKGAVAVALVINSPGGSPVQSRHIHDRIRALSKEKGLPVYAFAEDVAASGGYILALAGDKIYADASSILGSIGVIYQGFGFVGLIEKLGVERRALTAGDKKLTLDPFQPTKAEDLERLKKIQDILHKEFIALVRERRGAAIDQAGDILFTGEFWSGRQALDLGLIDGLADVRSKMREMFGEKLRLKLVTGGGGMFRRRGAPGVGFGSAGFGSVGCDFGAVAPGLADDLISALETRAMWARFGL